MELSDKELQLALALVQLGWQSGMVRSPVEAQELMRLGEKILSEAHRRGLIATPEASPPPQGDDPRIAEPQVAAESPSPDGRAAPPPPSQTRPRKTRG